MCISIGWDRIVLFDAHLDRIPLWSMLGLQEFIGGGRRRRGGRGLPLV